MNEKEKEITHIITHDFGATTDWGSNEDFEKELYKEYYKQLRSGDTNMGYEAWKLNNEIIHKGENLNADLGRE